MINISKNRAILFWLFSFLIVTIGGFLVSDIYAIKTALIVDEIYKSTAPLIVCSLLVLLARYSPAEMRHPTAYFIFFAISITSLLGLTETLTGSHAESSNAFYYGLSFYTASIAYLHFKGRLNSVSALNVSNPLLIFTGPISTFVTDIKHRNISTRISYYFPYIILGAFLHQSIATPLTQTFSLIENTDLVSSVVFAVIFELFVYANFCGLSLIVFGVAGLIGFRVPLNFRQPFSSSNVIEFWKGWHTSLSLVLKTIFYNPARKKLGVNVAILSVFFVSAMWHGVTINFLFWGVFHAIIFIVTLWFVRRNHHVIPFFLLFIAIVLGRLIFADSETDRLLTKLRFEYVDLNVFTELFELPFATKLSLIMISLFVFSEFIFQKSRYFVKRNYKFFRIPFVQLILLFITLVTLSGESGVDYAVYGQR